MLNQPETHCPHEAGSVNKIKSHYLLNKAPDSGGDLLAQWQTPPPPTPPPL